MSIMCAVYVPEGIALAADSRMTVTAYQNNDMNKTMTFSVSDNAQKIVLLNKVKVGISACGNAVLDNKTISDYLRIFEINEVSETDDVTDVANKLHRYAHKFFPATNFFVCGYSSDEPFVYTVNKEVVRNNAHNGQIRYLVVGRADRHTEADERKAADDGQSRYDAAEGRHRLCGVFGGRHHQIQAIRIHRKNLRRRH